MRIGRIAIVTLGCIMGAAAQDKITVPLTDPSQPVTIRVKISGSIRVTAGSGSDVIVTTTDSDLLGKSRNRGGGDPIPPGMTRIGGGSPMNIEEDHNVITIPTGIRSGDLVIQTPVNTNLQLKTVSGGGIDVSGVNGDLEVENLNGPITLSNISGSVVAHTLNGSITASLDRVTSDKPMSFISLNGKVDVSLPADTKARLRLKSNLGSIYSDFDVKMEPDSNKPTIEDSRSQNGKYKISIDRAVTGTINGGGPEYTFQTLNGTILIHKKQTPLK